MGDADFPRAGLKQAIEVLGAMPAYIAAALDTANPDELRYSAGEESFSLLEHACHLRDLEREGYLVRVRRILAEEAPELPDFDGAAVAKARDYAAQDAHEAARDFVQARRELIALLAPLTDAQLEREAIFHGERITLAGMVQAILEHDRGHRAEIDELVAAMESP
jgi:hypothetical protein